MMIQGDDYLEAIKDRYGFEEWLMDEDGQRPVLENFIADLGGVAGLTLLKRVATAQIRGHYADHYVLEEEADAAAAPSVHVMVNVMTCASSAEAKEALLFALARVMAPRLPECSERGLELGDICFCGVDEPPTGVYFVRNNLFVDVASVGCTPVPVHDLATIVDRQIQAQLPAPA